VSEIGSASSTGRTQSRPSVGTFRFSG
jgi:hypothetical protein